MAQLEPFQRGQPPLFNFEFDSSLSAWNVPLQQWLKDHESKLDGICVGIVVFNDKGRVLLIQRASHDSLPNKWEIPGGAVDDEDPSLLYGAARELWEETGFIVKRFNHFVPESGGVVMGQVFTNRHGTRSFCRLSFEVNIDESCGDVTLDPEEHQAFVWASNEEVRQQRIGDRYIPLISPQMQSVVLEAFRLRQGIRASSMDHSKELTP